MFFYLQFLYRVLVTTTSGSLSCFTVDLMLLWKKAFGPIFGGVQVAQAGPDRESVLLVTSVDSYLRCLQVRNGANLWSFRAKSAIFGSVAVCKEESIIAFGCNDNSLRLLSLDRGELLWEHNIGSNLCNPLFCENKSVHGCRSRFHRRESVLLGYCYRLNLVRNFSSWGSLFFSCESL